MEEPIQFSLGQTAQSLTCSNMEKPHTGLDDCLKMLLACSRKMMSAQEEERSTEPDPGEGERRQCDRGADGEPQVRPLLREDGRDHQPVGRLQGLAG